MNNPGYDDHGSYHDNSNRNQGNNGNNGNNKKGFKGSVIVIVIIAILLTYVAVSLFKSCIKNATTKEISYSEFLEMIEKDEIQSVEYSSNKIIIVPKEQPVSNLTVKYYTGYIYDEEVFEKLKTMEGVEIKTDIEEKGSSILDFILVYILFYVFSYFTEKHIGIYEVTQGTIAENNTYTGLIVRSESVYTSDYSGTFNYYIADNAQTGWNNIICSVDETGSVSDQLAAAAASDTTGLDSDYFKNLKSNVSQFTQSYDSLSFYRVYDFKENVSSQVMESVNMSALSDLTASGATASDTFHISYAQTPGLIAYYTDGYENITTDNFTADDIQPLDYKKTTIKNNSTIAAGDPIYKQITSENWNIILPVQKATYDRLTDSNVIEIKFKKDNTSCWVNYELKTQGNDYYVILSLHNNMVRFAGDRFTDVELLLTERSGLKIPNSSITEKAFYTVPKEYFTRGGDSNSLGLYVRDSKTNAVNFVATAIFQESETDYYIDEEEITAGSIIQKPDSNDTFEVQAQSTLQGVYNVNKGYAVFKQIDILYQNEEYTIVKAGTDFGISIYDHIALEGDAVSEDDLIN